jgi:hypothetical protein
LARWSPLRAPPPTRVLKEGKTEKVVSQGRKGFFGPVLFSLSKTDRQLYSCSLTGIAFVTKKKEYVSPKSVLLRLTG